MNGAGSKSGFLPIAAIGGLLSIAVGLCVVYGPELLGTNKSERTAAMLTMKRIATFKDPLPAEFELRTSGSTGNLDYVGIFNDADRSNVTYMRCPAAGTGERAQAVIDAVARGRGIPDINQYGTERFFCPQKPMSVSKQGELDVAGKKLWYVMGTVPEKQWDPAQRLNSNKPDTIERWKTFLGAMDAPSKTGAGKNDWLFVLVVQPWNNRDLTFEDAKKYVDLIEGESK